MDIDVSPTLKPLFHELGEISVRYYLASADFERACNTHKCEAIWDEALQYVENKRNYISIGYDHKPFDSEKALIFLLNAYFKQNKRQDFDWLISFVLGGFMSWSKKQINLDNILKDLNQLQINIEYSSTLKQLYSSHKSQFLKNERVAAPIFESVETNISFQQKKKFWMKLIYL